jgi:hypothetical protein
MLVTLHLRNWTAQKKDRDATRELNQQQHAAVDATSVVKNLLTGNDKELKDTQRAYRRIRTWFYENSLPWSADDRMHGSRMVATEQAIEFLGSFATLKDEADAARKEFIDVYEDAVQRAAARTTGLGDLYDPTAYPPVGVVQYLFGAALDMVPMPAQSDYHRVTLPPEVATGLAKVYERKADRRVEGAIHDAQARLVKELERTATQLGKLVRGEKVRLHKTLITNMERLVGLAESLGPLDAELEELATSVREDILSYELQDFRDNVPLARAVADKATRLASGVGQPKPQPVGYAPTVNVTTPEVLRPSIEGQAEAVVEFDEDDIFNLGD